MQLSINGKQVELDDAYTGGMLVWALRDGLGLIATKFGCGGGFCGSCTVHIDGVPTRSCITPVNSVGSSKITTLEGLLSSDGELHPIQAAFIEKQVPQCAWCMSGQMMSAAALLAENSNPSEDEIIAAMDNNYCRCGCYVRIREGVALAAEIQAARGGEDVG